jgi:UDP-N-acetylglucosamine 2-epimerase
VLAIPSLGQIRYLSAIKHAALVIGNSSSGIIEVPAFDVPTVNIGMRQKGRLAAKSVLHCEPNKMDIQQTMQAAIKRNYKASDEIISNPYGQGDASGQIVEMIKSMKFDKVKSFYDLKFGEIK